jgi:phage shock protein E
MTESKKKKHFQSGGKHEDMLFIKCSSDRKATLRKSTAKNRTALFIFFTVMILGFAGCSRDTARQEANPHSPAGPETEEETEAAASTPTAAPEQILQKIDAQQAKEMMDSSSDLILLDVRTQEEYNEGHIEGALLIPDYEISDQAGELLIDKAATILIYCRSGRRSALAAKELSDLGYSSVYDFGGIIDWPYEVITENQ